MSKLDLALLNGNNWSAAHVDAVEAGINLVKIIGTNAERLALAGVGNGQGFYCTDTKTDWLYDGAGWVIMSEPDQAYSPTFTNLTIGNASQNSSYHRSDGYCDFTLSIVIGSTTVFTGTPLFTYPATLAQAEAVFPGTALDVSTGSRYFIGADSWTTGQGVLTLSSNHAGLSAAVPFTWAVNDTIAIRCRYRMASRYT